MEILLRMSYVAQRKNSDWYSFKIDIPEDVRHHPDFGGRGQIWEALKTKDPILARQRAEPRAREWKAKIERVRDGLGVDSCGYLPARAVEISAAVIEKKIRGVDSVELGVLEAMTLNLLYSELDALKINPALTLSGLVEAVSKYPLFKWDDIQPLLSGSQPREALGILTSMVVMVRAALTEELRLFTIDGVTKAADLQAARQLQHEAANPPKPLLSEILKAVIEQDKERRTRMTNHIGALIEWLGDKPVDQYSYDDLITYRNNCLLQLPDRRKEKFKGLTLRQAIKAGTPQDIVSQATIENHLTSIKTIFAYAVRHHEISLNTEQLLPKKKKTRHDNAIERRYSQNELQGMINLLPTVKGSPAKFWVPLVSLYQGSRLNETCQLHTNDVRIEEESGIWILDFNGDNSGGTNKRIKTDSSWRKVPVHPTLIKLGFIEFVGSRKRETQGESLQLFHDVKWSKHHQYKRPVERWFNDGFRQEFLEGERKKAVTFHSLRHTFAQQAQNQARMSDRYRRELA